jgi:urease accessory protein UreF
MQVSFESTGSFVNTEAFLNKMSKQDIFQQLDAYARQGVSALSSATPVDSGLTAASWGYEIEKTKSTYSIIWTNTHTHNGVPVAILLQYGHGTGTGGYVQGKDYINPAIKPIFDKIADNVWKAVTSA